MIPVIQMIDESILLWIQENLRANWLTPGMELVSILGNSGLIWIALTVYLICWKPTRKAGILSAIALIFSLLVTNIGIKPLLERPRPYVTMDNLIPLVMSPDVNSFPSGHTSAAFAAGFAWLGVTQRKWLKAILIGQAVLMGLSRVYLGVHYPSDVICGAVIGVLCGFVANKLVDFWFYLQQKRQKP